jgi:hypothetical protein
MAKHLVTSACSLLKKYTSLRWMMMITTSVSLTTVWICLKQRSNDRSRHAFRQAVPRFEGFRAEVQRLALQASTG